MPQQSVLNTNQYHSLPKTGHQPYLGIIFHQWIQWFSQANVVGRSASDVVRYSGMNLVLNADKSRIQCAHMYLTLCNFILSYHYCCCILHWLQRTFNLFLSFYQQTFKCVHVCIPCCGKLCMLLRHKKGQEDGVTPFSGQERIHWSWDSKRGKSNPF
jgi:hypothetical protein